MIKIFIRYRRNSDGELVTIEHTVESEKAARRWCTVMENAIDKSEDVLVDYKWYWVMEGAENDQTDKIQNQQ